MTPSPIRLRPHLLRRIHLRALLTAMDGVQDRLNQADVLEAAGRFFDRRFEDGEELSRWLREREAHTQFHPWLLWDARLATGRMGARLLRSQLASGGADREVAEALLATEATVYQVIGTNEHSTVVERVADGRCLALDEPVLQAVSTQGELLVARILDLGDCHLLDAVHACLPPAGRRAMVRAARKVTTLPAEDRLPKLLAAASRAMRRLVDDLSPLTGPEGEPLVRATLVFEGTDRETVGRLMGAAAQRGDLLRRRPGHYVIARQSFGHVGASLRTVGRRLHVTTSSVSRLERIRTDLEAALPELRYRLTLLRDLNALLGADLEEGRGHEELARLTQEWVEEYLSRFQDTPQRTLDDMTPREAVRTRRGRDKVLAMLRSVERVSETVGADCRSQMDTILNELGRRAGRES